MKLRKLHKQDSSTGEFYEVFVDLDRIVYMEERTFSFKFTQPVIKNEERTVTELRLGDHICIYVKEDVNSIGRKAVFGKSGEELSHD